MDKKIKVIKELVKGKEATTKLQALMNKPSRGSDEEKDLANEFMEQILTSYNQGLLVLQSDDGEVFHHQDLMTNSHHVSNGFDDEGGGGGGGCEDSSESKKRPAVKDKRGCYKRRKSTNTWTKISPSFEDEHAWRKYGQKAILNCKYQRSYFRCTHKYDQGCKAAKQVQRVEDRPELYQIIYFGAHTCQEIMKVPQLILDSHDHKHMESLLVFSQSSPKIPTPEQHHINPFPTTTTSSTTFIKEEGKDDTRSDLTDTNNVSSMDSYMTNELMSIESAEPNTISSKFIGFDDYDVSNLYSFMNGSSSHEFEDALLNNYFDSEFNNGKLD